MHTLEDLEVEDPGKVPTKYLGDLDVPDGVHGHGHGSGRIETETRLIFFVAILSLGRYLLSTRTGEHNLELYILLYPVPTYLTHLSYLINQEYCNPTDNSPFRPTTQ